MLCVERKLVAGGVDDMKRICGTCIHLEAEGERYREQYYCMNHKCVERGFEKLKTDGCEAWEDDDEAITEKR